MHLNWEVTVKLKHADPQGERGVSLDSMVEDGQAKSNENIITIVDKGQKAQ